MTATESPTALRARADAIEGKRRSRSARAARVLHLAHTPRTQGDGTTTAREAAEALRHVLTAMDIYRDKVKKAGGGFRSAISDAATLDALDQYDADGALAGDPLDVMARLLAADARPSLYDSQGFVGEHHDEQVREALGDLGASIDEEWPDAALLHFDVIADGEAKAVDWAALLDEDDDAPGTPLLDGTFRQVASWHHALGAHVTFAWAPDDAEDGNAPRVMARTAAELLREALPAGFRLGAYAVLTNEDDWTTWGPSGDTAPLIRL